ncbi:MAG: hypothetical protein EOM30_01485 [Clostridia bacterium]|nr:hypothetical protein [Clostridia bacterium]
MTVKELSQLYWLNREIEQDQERLAELEHKASSPSSPNLTGMPSAKGGYGNSKIERYVAEILDLKAIIAAKQQQCIHERNRLERWICDVPDSLLRMIFTLRFINGLTWLQVALHIGGGNTEDSVKKACYRYLDKINAEDGKNGV